MHEGTTKRQLTKSVALGACACIGTVLLWSVMIGIFAIPNDMLRADMSFTQQHDAVAGHAGIQFLTILGWVVASLVGGLIVGFRTPASWLVASLYVGLVVVMLWGVPVSVIAGQNISAIHIASVLVVIPCSILGAWLAVRTAIRVGQ